MNFGDLLNFYPASFERRFINTIHNGNIQESILMYSEKKELVEMIISLHGADLLRIAANKGHADTVKVLLSYGVRDDIKSGPPFQGITALMIASNQGYADIVKYLLVISEHMANKQKYIDSKTAGFSALDTVFKFLEPDPDHKKYTEIFELLIRNGATITPYINIRGIRLATLKGYTKIVEILLSIGIRDEYEGKTALMIASDKGIVDIVRLLILHMDERYVNQVNEERTAIMNAIENGYNDILDLLFYKANPENKEKIEKYRAAKKLQKDALDYFRQEMNSSCSLMYRPKSKKSKSKSKKLKSKKSKSKSKSKSKK